MHTFRTTTRAVVLGSVAALTLAACSTGGTAPAPSGADAAAADHVTIQLDFQPRGLHSIFFVADDQGFFEDEGIVIDDILKGTSSGDTLRLVGSGQGDFGMADLPTLVVARSQGVPVQALAAVNQTSPLAMCTVADRHVIDDPSDLEGMRVGVHSSGSTYVFYKALLAANGVDPSTMTELTVQPPYEQYLLQEQVDTVPCYVDAEITILEEHAGGPGSLSVLMGSDWGYDAYGTGVFASDEMIESNPDLVQRFMNAYVRALQFVVENPDVAAETLAASSPELADNVELYTAQIQADIDSTFASAQADEHGLATMSDDSWSSMIAMLAEQGVIETSPAVEDVNEGQFVLQAHQS
jgi:NitT/TauT family transport system substrate-binding protein